ncbi:CinA family protein [Phytoactinopolyspora alkaliphila]|uniref:CinA family protein n=1 Tax=Phytoactinopolyspora alkaliphila TaxID=1783498 RepID=A0A6N9YFT8_9ACTN|nr:nicotinamide-nucleotide amidohydrolase family protein [Phytoactinopolyspora alkaliphila]NED93749.1 CinA family protein [Phytoactinopolyspora alkaliphila]
MIDGGVVAVAAVRNLVDRHLTLATAESLTGGLVSAALTAVQGSSAVLRAGVVVYATDTKASLAGVPSSVLDAHGPVAAETAAAMAEGIRRRVGADVGLATTGVAGPEPQDGHPPGTVYVAMADASGTTVRAFTGADRLTGARAAVREATVAVALEMLARVS